MGKIARLLAATLSLWAAPILAQDALCDDETGCRTRFEDAYFALTGPQDLDRADAILEHACVILEQGWACGALASAVVSGQDATDAQFDRFQDLRGQACLMGDARTCEDLNLSTPPPHDGSSPPPLIEQAQEHACLSGYSGVCTTVHLTVRDTSQARLDQMCGQGETPVACMLALSPAIKAAVNAEDHAATSELLLELVAQCLDGILPSCVVATTWRESVSLGEHYEEAFEGVQDLIAFACQQGDLYACSQVGFRMRDVPRNHPDLVALRERNCDAGFWGSCTFLANTEGVGYDALRREVLAYGCWYHRHPNRCADLRDLGPFPGSDNPARTAAALDHLIEAFQFD